MPTEKQMLREFLFVVKDEQGGKRGEVTERIHNALKTLISWKPNNNF